MYKKLITIAIIAVFLITSVGFISAADDSNSIPVKIIWDDSTNSQPGQVTVNLIKDGKVVDTAVLSSSNSWKTTFKVSDDGNYQVKEVISGDYSSTVSGNANTGFTITNKLVSNDVLGASDDDSLEDTSADNQISEAEDSVVGDNETSDNSTDTNNTDNSTDTNSTADDSDDDSDDDADDDSDDDSTTTTTKTTTSKTVKHDKKKPENKTKPKNNKTGLPFAALVLAVFVAAFVPFNRKK